MWEILIKCMYVIGIVHLVGIKKLSDGYVSLLVLLITSTGGMLTLGLTLCAA
jgi:hypothetical protein